MTEQLFLDYKDFVTDGFATFLPLIILFISVTLTFAIANHLRYFIYRLIRVR